VDAALSPMKKLFTKRHGAVEPRVAETLDDTTRDALLNLIRACIDECLGLAFPDKCLDGYAYAGTEFKMMRAAIAGFGLPWPRQLDRDDPPTDGVVFDLIEHTNECIAETQNPTVTATAITPTS
jgi:hypothetical protein